MGFEDWKKKVKSDMEYWKKKSCITGGGEKGNGCEDISGEDTDDRYVLEQRGEEITKPKTKCRYTKRRDSKHSGTDTTG